MELVRKYVWVSVGAIVIGAGFFFFYTRFYRDIKTLTDFSIAYEKFDKAIADFAVAMSTGNSNPSSVAEESGRNAEMTLTILQKQANERISSLIRNDAEFMRTTLEISVLARKEYEVVKAYNAALKDSSDGDGVSGLNVVNELKNKRQAAYVHFQELVKVTKGKGHL